MPDGEDVSCVLETSDGAVTTITGRSSVSTFMIMPPDVGDGMQLQQAIVRYEWSGESSVGMLERSATRQGLA